MDYWMKTFERIHNTICEYIESYKMGDRFILNALRWCWKTVWCSWNLTWVLWLHI